MSHSNSTVRWIARTAMGIALIIVAQLLGKVFPAGAVITGPFSVNQLVTGSLVNCVLFVFTAISGMWSGVAIGIVSAMLAQFIGIGPAVAAVSPVVALGNAVLCVVYWLANGRNTVSGSRTWIAMVLAAVIKCAFLWIAVPALLGVLTGVQPQQVQMLSIMFSWPQGCTALIGGTLASLIIPRLYRAK